MRHFGFRNISNVLATPDWPLTDHPVHHGRLYHVKNVLQQFLLEMVRMLGFAFFLLVWAVRGCKKTRFGTFFMVHLFFGGTVGWLWNKFWKNLGSFLPSVCAVASKLSSPFQKTFLLTSLSRNHVLTCKIPNGLLRSVWQKQKQLYPCVCKVLGPCVLEVGVLLQGI